MGWCRKKLKRPQNGDFGAYFFKTKNAAGVSRLRLSQLSLPACSLETMFTSQHVILLADWPDEKSRPHGAAPMPVSVGSRSLVAAPGQIRPAWSPSASGPKLADHA